MNDYFPWKEREVEFRTYLPLHGHALSEVLLTHFRILLKAEFLLNQARSEEA
jgi:hypothetical protein